MREDTTGREATWRLLEEREEREGEKRGCIDRRTKRQGRGDKLNGGGRGEDK